MLLFFKRRGTMPDTITAALKSQVVILHVENSSKPFISFETPRSTEVSLMPFSFTALLNADGDIVVLLDCRRDQPRYLYILLYEDGPLQIENIGAYTARMFYLTGI
jgi:hypothetical protein